MFYKHPIYSKTKGVIYKASAREAAESGGQFPRVPYKSRRHGRISGARKCKPDRARIMDRLSAGSAVVFHLSRFIMALLC